MNDHPNELLDDTCWVYVQQDDDGAYTIGITYDGCFRQRETAEGRPPLLWRRFDDTLAAAGYRIVLKGLPEVAFEKVLKENEDATTSILENK